MKSLHSTVTFYVICFLCGCSQSVSSTSTSPIQKYKLVESQLSRPFVSDAISVCNAIFQDDVEFRFRPSWEETRESNEVPVFLVWPYNLAEAEMIFIPKGEHFVIINEVSLRKFLNAAANETDHRGVVAAMLLHEAGHIVNHDTGSNTGSEAFSLGDLNNDNTSQKKRELLADKFAATQIRIGMQDIKNIERSFACRKMALNLSGFNFRLQSQWLLNNFGDMTPKRYWDHGYSHPNYQLRSMIIMHEIMPTDASRKLIEEFEENRDRLAKPNILWKK